jgi:hypothetical protein
VRAYVARDPTYYQQWFELRQAAAESTGKAARPRSATWKDSLKGLIQRLREFWYAPVLLGGGLASALALIWLVVLLLPLREPSEWSRILDEDQTRWGDLAGAPVTAWPWRGGERRGEARPEITTPEQQSFQFGVRKALTPLFAATPARSTILQGLAREPGQCTAADAACPPRQQAVQALGHWAALAHLACAQGRVDPAQLGQRLVQWGALATIRQSEPWRTVLGEEPHPEAAAPPCQSVRELLAEALLPR